MNAELKRYSLIHNSEYQSQMLQRHDGKYVRFADVNPAAIREAALREAAERLIEVGYPNTDDDAEGPVADILALIGEKK